MRRPFANLGIKLVSLALAVALWLVVAGEKTSEIGLTVPLELQNLPPELEVVGETVDKVELRLRATPAIVRRLGREDVSVRVELTNVDEGEHFFHLGEQAVRRPFGVRVVRINPSSLTLNLERTVARDVPVKARVVGTPASGFEVAGVSSEPASVRVVGPRSRVDALSGVFTEAVSVEQAKADVSAHVNVGIGEPLVRIQGDPRVRVKVQLRERRDTRRFDNLRVAPRGSGHFRLQPSRVSVIVAGPSSTLARLTQDALQPYVALDAQRASASRPVAVAIASEFAGVEVRSVEPPQVTVAAGGGGTAGSAPGAKR
jgi:YbbR domain-containing protein